MFSYIILCRLSNQCSTCAHMSEYLCIFYADSVIMIGGKFTGP